VTIEPFSVVPSSRYRSRNCGRVARPIRADGFCAIAARKAVGKRGLIDAAVAESMVEPFTLELMNNVGEGGVPAHPGGVPAARERGEIAGVLRGPGRKVDREVNQWVQTYPVLEVPRVRDCARACCRKVQGSCCSPGPGAKLRADRSAVVGHMAGNVQRLQR